MAPRTRYSRMAAASTTEDDKTQDTLAENNTPIQVATHTVSAPHDNMASSDRTKPNANHPSKFLIASGQIYLNL